ncbi:MAG: transposase [Bacteroides sp.]|nr:transposase [Bacteroides sp.]
MNYLCDIIKLILIMANSYNNIILHLVFAVKNRESLIASKYFPEFHKYIAGCFINRGHDIIEIGGTSNHIHILFRYNTKELLSDLIRDVKSSSSRFVYEKRYSPFMFNWQRGYGCFSVDCGLYDKLIQYIRNQEEHHRQYHVREEMRRLLHRCGLEYNEQYIFEDV